ncbi:site-specific DNA-methyltransferase [Pseudoflavonifractor phocaeensis]|uniref:site-specific DNA-methyltransferase n=1 Tax=Pseudoflavonifractor phocaeensis TaxID=1870988 RepID=UPI00195EAE99|nr:site-specific DNA-methyltransferase [Pseudoflavonifractor phocaeensis]MBM6885834.1 site-specific DNA-methyltransferase [Pseudoflavonifractor phocaeensis]
MPTLEWIGKDKVVNHHQEVPYRVLERQYSYDEAGQHAEDNSSENMIIHGDNLEALKALLPRYEGKVKCIYIDPPYNTGNEGWVYNDNVNDPKIKKWLGEVVGKEGEDLSRHDKWLCMMYPRLKLLQRLLRDDGAIFISIDDTEQSNLRLICDEIFGTGNFISDVIWQHSVQANGYGGKFVSQFNHTLVYSKSSQFVLGNLPRSDADNKLYKNPDNDPRGPWRAGYCVNGLYRPNLKYEIQTPHGNIISPPEKGWRWSRETMQAKLNSGEIIFNVDETAIIHKLYLSDLNGKVPENIWAGGIAGTTRQATAELKVIFDGKAPFDTPKPTCLIERIIQIASDPDSIILDSFAGSGTTAHAVLNMNKADGGNRKFILVEMMDYADSITAERVKRVIDGYGEGKKAVEGTGGNFSYYDLGPVLLLPDGNLNEEVGPQKIREYVYYMETKESLPSEHSEDEPYFMGLCRNTAYYFYYERERVTTLDHAFLATVQTKAEGYTIYADLCAIPQETLHKHNITFKKIPRDIARL